MLFGALAGAVVVQTRPGSRSVWALFWPAPPRSPLATPPLRSLGQAAAHNLSQGVLYMKVRTHASRRPRRLPNYNSTVAGPPEPVMAV